MSNEQKPLCRCAHRKGDSCTYPDCIPPKIQPAEDHAISIPVEELTRMRADADRFSGAFNEDHAAAINSTYLQAKKDEYIYQHQAICLIQQAESEARADVLRLQEKLKAGPRWESKESPQEPGKYYCRVKVDGDYEKHMIDWDGKSWGPIEEYDFYDDLEIIEWLSESPSSDVGDIAQGEEWISTDGRHNPPEYAKVLLYWEGLKEADTGYLINGSWVNSYKEPHWAIPEYWRPIPKFSQPSKPNNKP